MPDDNRTNKAPSDREMARLRRAKESALPRLLRIPGVHSVGIGYKRVGDKTTDQLAVLVFVDEKLPRSKVQADWFVPAEVRFHWETSDHEEAVPTDVIARPRAVPYPHVADGSLATRVRPVPGGRSIQGVGGGTLGGWVWDDINDQAVLLSNNHVLGGTAGTDVFQPWGSTAAADRIADVVRTGTLDATIAGPSGGGGITLYEIEGIGPAVYEVAEATLNMEVEKSGATTEHTTGRVVTVGLSGHSGSTTDFEIDRDAGIDRFAYYGDSGSLIVERTNPSGANWKRVVGLLWGGIPTDRNGFSHQMQDVFADLSLKTICTGVVEEILDALFSVEFAARSEEEMSLPEPAPAARSEPSRGEFRSPVPRWRSTLLGSRGFARDIEKRIARTERGKQIVDAVNRNRIGVVRLLLDPEARRALHGAVAPFVRGAWTADEVLERNLTRADVERFRRLLVAASARRDLNLGELLRIGEEVLAKGEGRRLGDVLG